MRIAYIDAVGGAAGDMLLSALLAARGGERPEEYVGELLGRLGIGDVRFTLAPVRRSGFKGWLSTVEAGPGARVDWRSVGELAALIGRSALPAAVKGRAVAVYRRIARAEAEAHGEREHEMHLHETGDVDAVVEIAGTLSLLEDLGVGEVRCSPLPMGSGTIVCSHGPIPLPAPAVAAMLEGVEVRPSGEEGETVTPTGIALLKEIVGAWSPMPAMRVERTGVGAGLRERGGLPNILRVFVGEAREARADGMIEETCVVVEANIDDMPPLLYEHVFALLFEAGALDAWVTPILMKKGRPAHQLSFLCGREREAALAEIVFRETTSTGLRSRPVEKRMIRRTSTTVATPWGEAEVKIATLDGARTAVSPEYESCRKIARDRGVPLQRVMEAAAEAARKGRQ